jgi:hypothetical protein
MARDEDFDIRRELVGLLLNKVYADPYPSSTMMNIVEQLVTPREEPAYAIILMAKIQADTFPSIDLIKRVSSLG